MKIYLHSSFQYYSGYYVWANKDQYYGDWIDGMKAGYGNLI